MKKLVEAMLVDLSTKEAFLFKVRCETCGREFASRSVRFSKAGAIPETREKGILYQAVYDQEFNTARQSALRKVSEHFNHCPICKQLVCNECFLICEDLDMCKACAANLNETGIPVASDMSMPEFCASPI